jgi:hypothetical protein
MWAGIDGSGLIDGKLTALLNRRVAALTAIIAWENASSKFNRALRIPSQRLWKRA